MDFLKQLGNYLHDPNNDFEKQLQVCKDQLISLIEKGFRPRYRCTIDECKIVSHWIEEENQRNGKHMLEKTPEQLHKDTENGCVMFMQNDRLVGFITLMSVNVTLNDGTSIPMFERGSLVVNPKNRKQGLASSLIAEMLYHRQKKPMYSITNVPAVRRINEKYKLTKYTQEELPECIRNSINNIEPMLPDDVIYGNKIFDFIVKTQK